MFSGSGFGIHAVSSNFEEFSSQWRRPFQVCLCNVVRRKPATTIDNILRDFGIRYVEGFTPPNFADLVANVPFSE
jgi:hypothetical protein